MEPEPETKAAGSDDEEEGMDPALAAMMGFGGFGTTKVSYILRVDPEKATLDKADVQDKKVADQVVEGKAQVYKERTWRQYMNRRGGFNRPLEKMK